MNTFHCGTAIMQYAACFGRCRSASLDYYRSPRRFTQLLLVEIRKIYAQAPNNRNYGVGRILMALE